MRTFSHVALAVGRGEGPLAARLLSHLGLAVNDNGPSLLGDPWYTAIVDEATYGGGLEHLGFFVVPVSDAQVELERTIAGTPAAEALMAEKRRKPDSSSHVALAYESLDTLEQAVTALLADAELHGRVDVLRFRPEEATPAIEARLDGSPVYADATRVRYLADGVQAFVQTDVVSAGLLSVGQSFELNHTFS